MRYVLARLSGTFLAGAVLAVALVLGVLPKCEGPGPHPYQAARISAAAARHIASARCSRAYGQCEATEFVHVRADGTEWIETCFAAPAVVEGHGDVRVAVDYCYLP